jgi:hypothetical protein
MNVPFLLNLLKSILPTKKIAAYLVGLASAIIALAMGLNSVELKAQFCATQDMVQLPKMVIAPTPAPMSTPSPTPAN